MAIQDATPIVLTADERVTLEGWVRSREAERRLVERATIVLAAAAGRPSRAIAREVGCARGVVSKWRVRFAHDRLAGLADAPRSDKPKTYGPEAGRRILALLDRPPQGSPAGPRRCSPARWATRAISTSGGSCARSGSTSPGARPGASAPTPSSRPRPPRSSACICTRPTTPWSWRSTRSRDPGPGAGAGLPQAAQRPLAPRPGARIPAARHHDPVRRAQRRHRRDQGQAQPGAGGGSSSSSS